MVWWGAILQYVANKVRGKNEMPTVWEIGIGTEYSSYEELKKRRVVAQGWSDTGDLSNLFGQPENIIRNDPRIKSQGDDPPRIFANLLYWIKPGDLVIACEGTRVKGICEIGSVINYCYDLDGKISGVNPKDFDYKPYEKIKDAKGFFEYANCLYSVDWIDWSIFQENTKLKPPSIAGQGVRGIVTCRQDPESILDAWRKYKKTTESNTQTRANTMEYKTKISIFDDFRQIILHGPPGTSKTYQAKRMAAKLILDINDEEIDDLVNDLVNQEEKSGTGEFADKRFRITRDQNKPDKYEGQWAIVQFHPAYNYEDFVRGIQVSGQGEKIRYENVQRIFSGMCKAAEKYPDKKYVLIIDEINRAHIAAVLGELIYGLEYRNARITTPYAIEGDDTLLVPDNLYIIGTMNTADRSIGHIDYAVRRRFAFVSCPPDPVILENYYKGKPEAVRRLAKQLFEAVRNVFNKENLNEFDAEDVCPGHTYFMAENERKLWNKFIYQVYPLLREYYKDGVLRQNATLKLTNDNIVSLNQVIPADQLHNLLDKL